MATTTYTNEEHDLLAPPRSAAKIPVTVIVAARNEAHNLVRCLESVREFGEVYVVDSASMDGTADIARSYGANVVQFHYAGGWPRKRQWAMDTLPLSHDWIFLMDADESVPDSLRDEILQATKRSDIDGYYIGLQMFFLGRRLRHGGAGFQKLSLFRRGKGHFERRAQHQDISMGDMEVHEHIVVDGHTASLKNTLLHNNVESLYRYIQKHNEYSNWEVEAWNSRSQSELRPSPLGSQAQRRRWLRKKMFGIPGSPVLFFLYRYMFRLGFLDGIPGVIYCGMQGIQFFNIKAKIYESRLKKD